MIVRMNQNSPQYGPALYRILEQEWVREGLSRNAWCRQHPGINPETIYRWSQGSDPGFDGARLVADTVGRPILKVLVEIGFLTPDEANASPQLVASLDDALRLDPSVSEYEQAIITEVRRQFRDFDRGASDSTTVDMPRRPKRGQKDPGA